MSAATEPLLAGTRFPAGAAVVIGGSGGIGAAICRRLVEHGSAVALSYRSNRAAAEEVVDDCGRLGGEANAAALDLEDRDSVSAFMAAAAERFGAVHTVVYAVGAPIPMVYAGAIEPADWQRTIDSELGGFYNVVGIALPYLRESRGSLVAVSSAGLRRHPPKDILSTVPKAAIEALVRGVAREEGRYGVRANTIALGVVEAGHFHKVADELPPEFIDAMRRNTAIGRLGTAREAADAVVFLASPAAGYITGASLTVDGGYSV